MMYFKTGTLVGTYDKAILILGALAGFLFGGWTDLLTALLVLHLLDIVTGLLVGGKQHKITSDRMDQGIKKKVGSWIALILANVIDGVLFEGQSIALTGVIFVLIGNEGLSIIENLGKLGVPLPDMISQYLEQVRQQGDTTEVTVGLPPAPDIEKVTVEDEDGQIQEISKDKGE